MPNGDFESATDLEGWSLVTSRAYLDGSFTIDGKRTPIDTTYPNNGGLEDGDGIETFGIMSGGITTTNNFGQKRLG